MLPEVLVYGFFFALSFYYIHLQSSKKNRFAKDIGGPPGYPLIGNALEFIKNSESTIYTLLKWVDQYGGRFTFYFGPSLVFVINDVEDIEKVLTSTTLIQKSEEYDMIKDWLGKGLITSSGQHWAKMRKMLTPSFHFSILERFMTPINAHASVLGDKLHNSFILEKNAEYLDICPLIASCALDIICETSMGIRLNAQTGSGPGMDYVNAVHRMGELLQYRMIRPWIRKDFTWNLTASRQEEIKCLQIIHSLTDQVIADRKRLLESVEVTDDEFQQEDAGGGKARHSFLDLLIKAQKAGNAISDAEIREEVSTFIFAGHDTVSVTTNFCLFNVGNHPEVQEKLHREMDAIFQGDNSREITIADIREMKYLECCIKESLRIHPSVPIIARHTTEDFRLDEKTVVPSDVALFILPYKVHRNPKYFPKAEAYIPERFAEGSCMANKNAFAYIPFSAGPRNCIGQKLAMMEAKILLATIFRRFHVKSQNKSEELHLFSEIVLRTKSGLKLSLQER